MAAAAVAGGLLLDDGVQLGEQARRALPLRTGPLAWCMALQMTCTPLQNLSLGFFGFGAC